MDSNEEKEFQRMRAEALECPHDTNFLMSTWNLEKAIELIFNEQIEDDVVKSIKIMGEMVGNIHYYENDRYGAGYNQYRENYRQRIEELTLDNIESGILPIISSEIIGSKRVVKVAPRTFLHWAKKQGCDVDEAMAKLDALNPVDETDADVSLPKENKGKLKKNKGSYTFPMPKGANWGDVSIRFRDGHSVTVKIGVQSEKPTFIEMGMKNERDSKPTKAWGLLQHLADNEENTISRPKGKSDALLKQIGALRKALKEYFSFNDDPIPFDKESRSWIPKFQILPENTLQDRSKF